MSRADDGGSGHAELVGIALAALAGVSFGTMAITAKFAYRAGATPMPLLAARFALTAVVLVVYHRARGISMKLPSTRDKRLVGLLGLGYALEALLFFLALERAPASIVALVFYSFPLFTTVLAFFAGLEKIHRRTIVALELASGGVLLIFSIPATSLAGPLIALASAIAIAVYLLVAQVSMRTVVPSVAATGTAAWAALVLGAGSFALGRPLPVDALPAALALAAATSIAFVAFYAAIARLGSSRAAVAVMVEPVATLILATLILNEELGVRIVLGALLIVAALPVLASTSRTEIPAPDSL